MDFTISTTGPKRMTKNFFFLLITFTLISSCSFLSKKIEALVGQEDNSKTSKDLTLLTPKNSKKILYCAENKNINLLLEDESTVRYYQPLLPIIFESKLYSFTQKAAFLSLIEMSRRPDEASPSARLQYFLRINNKNYYYDFRTKDLSDDTKMPFLKGIEVLIKNFDPKKNLKQIAEKLNSVLPPNMDVSPEMEDFLQTNRNELIKNEQLADIFFKGDEVLTKHESFKRADLKKLIQFYLSENRSSDLFYEGSNSSFIDLESPNPSLNLKCNVNINNEFESKDATFASEQRKSHYFGFKEGDNYFLAVSSAITMKPFKNYSDSMYFLRARSTPHPLPICQFKNSRQDITLISTSGRNPTQHLKHLATYDIDQVTSFNSLGELLNFSRHLFLNDPDRILYESKRGRKSQLDFFLTMNFPIYHVETLGDVIGAARFKEGNREESSLVIDDRSQSRLWCGP